MIQDRNTKTPKKIRKPSDVPSVVDVVEDIKRHVHYYKLLVGFNVNLTGTFKENLMALFKAVNDANTNRSDTRFLRFDGRSFCIQGLTVKSAENLAYGSLCTIRNEDFPRVFNMNDDSTRDIDAEEFEGIVEVSHFVIDYKNKIPILALEYNLHGARIQDFTRYFTHIGDIENLTGGVGFEFLVYDELSRLKKRIGRVSKLTAKAYRDMIPQIKNMNEGLATALDSAGKQFESEDITLILKFDYKHRTDTKSVKEIVTSLIDQLVNNKEKTQNFLQLKVEAEDSEHNNTIQAFDLLADKVRSTIVTQKNKRSRTLISNTTFNKMIEAMDKLKL